MPIAALCAACAHGIDSDLDLSPDDGGTGSGQTTGPAAGSGTGGESGGPTSGSGGRGDPTGVGGTAGAGGATSASSTGGAGGSGVGTSSSTSAGGSGGSDADGGSPAGAGGSAGQGGSAGSGGSGGIAGAGGTGGAGGNGGVVVRDAGPFTTVDDSVTGTATNQFNYVGTWGHCMACTTVSTPPLHNASNSWAGGVDASGTEYMTFAFVGSELQFYGVKDPRNGIGAASIDGGTETKIDFYAAVRAGDTLLYSSPVLAQGSHTFKLRVTSMKNASSAGTTITVDRIDVR
jgi:hypothetical protein